MGARGRWGGFFLFLIVGLGFFFFSSRRRHTRSLCDWSSDVCSSDLHRFHLVCRAARGDRAGECAPRARSRGAARSAAGDRKSTRLNSSHTVISYAVFCLKKKKKKKNTKAQYKQNNKINN